MKKTTLAAIAALPVLGIGILGVSAVSAQGPFGFLGAETRTPEQIATTQLDMFQHEATILGISIDDVKNAWAEGKGMKEIIKEKGLDETVINQRVQAEHEAQMKEEVQALVNKGIITQAQADTRLLTMKNHPMQKGMGMGGFMKGGRRMHVQSNSASPQTQK